jgi:hypothetical protein
MRSLRAVSRRAMTTAAAAALLAPAIAVLGATPAHAETASAIAALADANIGKGAGTCSQVNSSKNSLGGDAFYTSCTGNGGSAEYWCADFAMWVWANAGAKITGLTPGAGSFIADASDNGSTVHTSSSYAPQVGDAVVYDYNGDGYAQHVGIVTAVNSDGSIQTANGDFGGNSSGSESEFAETSTVESIAISASQKYVGDAPTGIYMTISAFVTPGGLTSTGSFASAPVVQYGSQMQVFGRDSSGATYSRVYTPSSGWSGWNDLGGDLADDPVALEYNTLTSGTQMEVFGRAASGSTYSDVYTPGGTWSGWQDLGGNIVSDPVAIQYGTQMEVYGIAANGSTYSDVYTPGGSWSGWQDVGGNLVGDLSVIVYGTQLQVYGRDSSGATYSRVYTPSSGWSGWTDLGGDLTSNPVAIEYDTQASGPQVEVYGEAANGSTYSDVYTPGGTWSGWQDIGGNLVGNVTPVVYGTQLQVYGRDSSGATYSRVYTPGSGWSGWTDLGGDLTSDPAALEYDTQANGPQMEVYGRAANGSTYADVYSQGGTWSGWQDLGGNLLP